MGSANVSATTVTPVSAATAAPNAPGVGGRNYSPTPIQRPAHQGKQISGSEEDSGVDIKDKKTPAEDN